MSFEYKKNNLFLIQGSKSVSLLKLAKQNAEPFYVYDMDALLDRLRFFKKHIAPAQVFYAMKANSHSQILQVLSKEDVGVDVCIRWRNSISFKSRI